MQTDESTNRFDRAIAVMMEIIVVAIVCVSPWFFGAVEVESRLWIRGALAVLLCLWAVRMVVRRRVNWKPCPVAACLAATFMLGVFQLGRLPGDWLGKTAPGQVAVYERTLPVEQETLADADDAIDATASLSGRTISFYPAATRDWLGNLLAVFTLFVIVRNTSTAGAIRRLGIVSLANGAALSLFGLIQFFSTIETGEIYWTYATDGVAFGPFVNRNHFAFYVNICIGLAVGLLLMRKGQAESRPSAPGVFSFIRSWLNDPTTIWICGGVVLMLSGVVVCVSRGGFLALLVATLVCSLFGRQRRVKNRRFATIAISLAVAVTALGWIGVGQFEERMSTLWTGEAYTLEGGRVFLLSRAWPVFSQFPIFGTGYGTFRFIESIWFHTPQNVGVIYYHAHNDYLEDLVEGGLLRLGLRIAAIAFVFRCVRRALKHWSSLELHAWTVGGLFAFTTIVVHSFFEFGLHLPAITALATVVVAHVCNLADATSPVFGRPAKNRGLTLSGLWPFCGALVAVLLAYFLFVEGTRDVALHRLKQEARAMRELAFGGSFTRAREIPFLQQALRLEPHDAETHFQLAEAFFAVGTEQSDGDNADSEEIQSLIEAATDNGIQYSVRARNLCPVLPAPHTRIAVHHSRLKQADPMGEYLSRAKFLAPMDPRLWYFCGIHEWDQGRPEAANVNWKRSIELSEKHLTEILDRWALALASDEILPLLPSNPHLLYRSAEYLYPQADALPLKRPYFKRALDVFNAKTEPLSAKEWRLKAILHTRLEEPSDAISAMRTALMIEPLNSTWRYELAKMLADDSQWNASRNELRMVTDRHPNHALSLRLLDAVQRKMAEASEPTEMRDNSH